MAKNSLELKLLKDFFRSVWILGANSLRIQTWNIDIQIPYIWFALWSIQYGFYIVEASDSQVLKLHVSN